MKRINKILWHGVDIPIPSAYEGSLDGLNCGELYIYENDEDPAIFIKTNKNKVKRIGGGGGGTTDINEILDLIDQKLNGYATEEWVSSTYATKTALSTLSSSVNSLRTDFDNLNALLNDDVTGKINTWYEVVDFLDEYSGSQDLAAILSGMNTDIASRVEKSKFADYFATEMAKWFVKDDTNKGLKPANSYGLYSETYVSAKGVSTGTGGSGGGSSYNRLDRWSDYTSDKAGWVLSALLGQDLNSRIASLESGSALSLVTTGDGNAVTAIAKSGNQLTVTKGSTFQSLITSSNKLAYSLISGTPTSLPASDVAAWAKAASKPSYAFSEITNKPTTLGGYGITDTYTATTIDGKLSGYLPLSGGTMLNNSKIKWGNNVQSWDDLDGGFSGICTAREGNDYWAGLSFKGWYGFQIRSYGVDTDLIQVRGATNTAWGTWRNLIHSGNIGSQSVESAAKLTTPRSIWGQSFDGTGDVSGHLTGVDFIQSNTKNGYFVGNRTDGLTGVTDGGLMLWSYGNTPISFHTNASTHMKITGEGNILIGNAADSGHKLAVYGNTYLYDNAPTNDITTCLALGADIEGVSAAGKGVGITIGQADNNYYTKIATIFEQSNPRYLNPAIAFYTMHNTYLSGSEVERMRITSAGKVGIGTTKPLYKLDVVGAARCQYMLFYGTDGTTQAGYIGRSATANNDIYILSSGALRLGTNNVDSKVIIDTSGNVGIGTTSPTEKLHVAGNIVATGSVTAKSSSSDIRLKKELTEYSALEIIKNQRSVMYKWNDIAKANSEVFNTDAWQFGLLAQELQATHPQLVSDVFGDYLTINYERLIPIVWRGVQEVDDEVTRLKAEVQELKNRISIMEGGRYGC